MNIDKDFNLEDPIFALATPWGRSALAVIRLSGKELFSYLTTALPGRISLRDIPPRQITRRHMIDPSTGEVIDELMLALYKEPHSYTGQDMLELYCHGGIPTILRIFSLLRSLGLRDAQGGEFSLRAFVNGKLDLSQAEAVNELISAQSDKARQLALRRLHGGLSQVVNNIKERLINLLCEVEVQLDYPDESDEHINIDPNAFIQILNQIDQLLGSYRAGKIYQEGAVVAVAGRPNAGKSTLFNLLLKEERAIVSTIPGTTRDFLDGFVSIKGIPIHLYDTAGLRDSAEEIEIEGIRRTHKLLEHADLIIYVVDAQTGLKAEDKAFISERLKNKSIICLWNKIDLSSSQVPADFIPFSAQTAYGLAELEERLYNLLVGNSHLVGESLAIDSELQKEALEKARHALMAAWELFQSRASYDLLASELQQTIHELGYITGEVSSSEVLARVFSRFCVGK